MVKRRTEYVESKDRAQLSVGDIIRMSLELNEMTQAELAEQAKIHPSNLSDIISGKRKIGREVAARLAKVLNIPPGHILFSGEEARKGLDARELYPSSFLNRIHKRNLLLKQALKKLSKEKELDTIARKSLIHLVEEASELNPLKALMRKGKR